MLRKFRERMESEKGFTLIELLVVILIIGILAAIALPAFLGQQKKGQDASAKSDARNLVSQVESCVSDDTAGPSYNSCNTKAQLEANGNKTGLDLVDGTPAAGQVAVGTTSATGFTVIAQSKSGVFYAITKNGTTGVTSHACGKTFNAGGTAMGATDGGCKGAANAGTW